jgi:hypothetical protein
MPNDFKKFASLLAGLGEMYDKEITPMMADMYWDALKEFDYEAVSKAAQLHMKNPEGGQFFPKVADLVRHLSGNNTDKGMQAWSRVEKAVRTVGPYMSVAFDDPIIHAVIQDMGGWTGFGNCDEQTEWPFRQNEFVKRYRAYLNAGGAGKYPAVLTGIADMHNRTLGKVSDKDTRLIGDPKHVMAVMLKGQSEPKDKPVALSDLKAALQREKDDRLIELKKLTGG